MTLTTTIQLHHGAPTLCINGQPDSGLMLYHNNVERGHAEMADFARAGIDLITTGIGGTECWRQDGTLDTALIDARMEDILAANPRALVLNRLGLHPPRWWAEVHPDDMIVHFDPNLDAEVEAEWRSPAFSSPRWREEMGVAMQAVIRYCEARYGEQMLGYHLCAGDCGEWSYAWRNYTQSDYSPAQRAAFRHWLGNPAAEIPRDWRRAPGASAWLDAEADELLRQYMAFHSQCVAEAIVHFSRLAKAQLRALGREKITAIFYGYHFTPPGNPSAFFNSGHHALATVLHSPDVDVLCAPYSYFQREAGGTYYSQLVTGSARLHGKLCYSEEDTVTHVVPPVPYRYHSPDEHTTEQVLLRNVLGALRDGGTCWYMDWFGQNWYRDEQLMASIAATQRLARERLAGDNRSVAEIAVFVSERTVTRLRHDDQMINALTLEQLPALWRIGAPLDTFLLSDFAQVQALPQYRLLIVLDAADEPLPAHPHLFVADGTPLDADLLRCRAREAGVHIYSAAGEQVLAEASLLAIHAGAAGDRTIHLPRACTVREAFSGKVIATKAGAFSATLARGDTAVWRLE